MLRKFFAVVLIACFAGSTFVHADEGMWTFDNPPLNQWKERYNFEPTREWLDNLRLASVRLSDGGSSSFVSPNGLLITNQHVASGQLAKSSTRDVDYIKSGFYAKSEKDEIRVPDLEANILISYDDVTTRVLGAVKKAANDAHAAEQRKGVMADIERECVSTTGLKCEVISFYSGGEYWLYRFKKYADIRIVFAPEEQIAFFGGDYDNFVYPRYDLDVTFLRVYENGKPIHTPNYFKWSEKGAQDGEFIVLPGNPGSTSRLLTVSQLKYQRDVGNPLQKLVWESRLHALEGYSKRGPEQARQAHATIRSLNNSLKRLSGQQDGLLNPKQFGKKEKEEADLKAGLAKKPALSAQYAPAWAEIGRAYAALPKMANRIAFTTLAPSRLGAIASQIVRYAEETKKANDQRYDEFRDNRLESLKLGLLSPAPIYPELEEATLSQWLIDARKALGPNDAFIRATIGMSDPATAVHQAITNTTLKDPGVRKALLDGGAAAVVASNDPLIKMARAVEPIIRELRAWNETNITNVESVAGQKIAQARFAVYGKSMPPDANFNLRISYGRVKGYVEDTTLVPYKTTFYGLYDRADSFNQMEPWNLPDRWQKGRDKLDLSTPLDFVYTADTIGGNSGSPVVNRNGEFVGINFDSNNQKLSNRYWYVEEEESGRAVGVHSAGIIEALRKLYKADDLVRELLEH
jgi:hypothetical protein